MEVDINGAKLLYKKGFKANYIGLVPPSINSLRSRLKERSLINYYRKSESTDQITKRLVIAQDEMNEINEASFFTNKIINDDIETAYRDLRNEILSLYPNLKNIAS